jgi:hypothetical protein
MQLRAARQLWQLWIACKGWLAIYTKRIVTAWNLYISFVAFPGAGYVADPFDVDGIRNTLSLYPLAIDGKNFPALGLVFATNAVANYFTPLNVLTPLSTIESALEASLAPVTTQNSFGTQVIDVLSPNTAVSVTYYTATHFGMGQFAGQIVTAYGQYQDVWAKQTGNTWKISHRNLVYMVRHSVLHHIG